MVTVASGGQESARYIAIAATALSAVSLLSLHVVSPEFAPSWRMVSEYADGRYSWLLTAVFVCWAVSSFALVAALWPLSSSKLGLVGLAFLALAGVGEAMGGMFDIHHPLHGPAAMIGIPSLCVAAVVLTTAHLPWISFALMLGAFALFFSQLKAAGVNMSGQAGPLSALPKGVVGLVGWANRMIFAASYLWTALAALSILRARG